MSEHILYYLGAGASAKALPLAKSVYDSNFQTVKIPGLAHELKNFDFSELINYIQANDGGSTDFIANMSQAFKALADKANEFGDVDTYAKYLLLKSSGGNEFQNLKQTLSQYFSLKQVFKKVRDTRYVPWLVSIMNRKQFPDNVKILSWNYDYQVELACSHFMPTEDISYNLSSFTYKPGFIYHFPTLDPTFSDYRFLSLIHLNGIAGYSKQGELNNASIFQHKFMSETEDFIPFLKDQDLHSFLHFAWEGGRYHQQLMQHVESMITGTNILVVIGYSFPFFNREVDKQVFEKLKLNNSFNKIYYQDPVLNGQHLRSQFALPEGISITHIPSIENFYIPFEY